MNDPALVRSSKGIQKLLCDLHYFCDGQTATVRDPSILQRRVFNEVHDQKVQPVFVEPVVVHGCYARMVHGIRCISLAQEATHGRLGATTVQHFDGDALAVSVLRCVHGRRPADADQTLQGPTPTDHATYAQACISSNIPMSHLRGKTTISAVPVGGPRFKYL